ncbi:MAG TPA: bifunctional DNA primase/polymerase [Thermoguttaceae bacterium]|nr:bifunctional DNA primase/polymerase [Thermoguttaceae bacterium]
MKYVICYSGQKRPIGDAWQNHTLTWQQVTERLKNDPALNVGILLGPASGVVDVECDSDAATTSYRELFGDVRTPSWQSARGIHHLFQWDERLAGLGSKVDYQAVEFRLGADEKATQSICPPSVVDGVKREWRVRPDECKPAPLPELVIKGLCALPRATAWEDVSDPMFEGVYRELRAAKIGKLTDYFSRTETPVVSTHVDHRGWTYLHLERCPFKHPEHGEGDPCAIVFSDGGHTFKCQHTKCANKKWPEIEEVYGVLNPVIRITPDLYENVRKAIRALTSDPTILQRVGLVEVVHDAPRPELCKIDNRAPQLRSIPAPTLKARLSAAARFEKWDARKDKWVHCLPSDPIVSATISAPYYADIPKCLGVVSSPVLRSDGTIAAGPGYDRLTGLYIATEGTYPPLMPVPEAVSLLKDVLVDFPFESEKHQAGWFAALLTLLVRSAFAGCAPFFLFDSNRSRVGKGLLTDAITKITENRKAARYDTPKSAEEMRKALTTVALAGAPYLLFDNIKHKFGGGALENLLTTGRWTDRLLGLNKQVDLPVTVVCMGTGNNCSLTGDMVGRTCHIRLKTDLEQPGLRTGFKYPKLLDHIEKNRPALVIAALSIPASYLAAGSPDQKLSAFGGFEGWSDLVRSSLAWAGLPDPDTRQKLAEHADDERDQLRALMEGWSELGSPMTVAGACDVVASATDDKYPILRAVISELPRHLSKQQGLGNLLKTYRGRVLDGRQFEKTDHKIPRWYSVEVTYGTA